MYQVNWAEVDAASTAVKAATNSLNATLGDINSAGNKIHWSSDAHRVYLERQATWNKAGENINNALAMFVTNLRTAAEIASNAERDNMHRLAR
jgi:uncharacterized protein YukE